MVRHAVVVLTGCLLGAGVSPAGAAEAEGASRDRRWLASLYVGRWAVTNLPDLPRRMVDGTLRFEDTYYAGAGAGYALIRAYDLPLPWIGRLRGNSLELDMSVLRHFNIQDNWEVSGALLARTGQIHPGLGLAFNLAAGAGLSYAFSDTALEIGRGGVQGEDTYRLQIHLVLEVELMHRDLPDWSLVARVHHRSGAYGLVSPQRTGSNFLAFGLRRSF